MFDVLRGEHILLSPLDVNELVEVDRGVEEIRAFVVLVIREAEELLESLHELAAHLLGESGVLQDDLDLDCDEVLPTELCDRQH